MSNYAIYPSLKDRAVFVTGGGTGIGKEISKLLAAAGAHVVVNYSRSEAEAIATAKEIETNHVQALPIKADVYRLPGDEPRLPRIQNLEPPQTPNAASVSQAATSMRCGDTNLVDPYFRPRLVGMDVMNRRHEADDQAILEGDS